MRAALLPALLAALAAPAAAAAAPPWSPPQDVSRPHTFVTAPSLVAGGDGSWLAAWAWQDGVGAGARTGDSVAPRRLTAGAFGPERPAPAGRVGDPVAYGASRVALALLRPAGSNRAPRGALRVALGRTSGRFARSRLVARRHRIASPAFAGDARGDLALAWFEDRGTSNDRVFVALRRAGHGFGRPLRLATGRIRSVTVAVGPRGDVLVAWDARGVVRARFKRFDRRRFGTAQTIRSDPTYFATLRAGVTANGRAYLAWSAQFLSEGGDRGPVLVEAAVRPARRGRFRAAQRLDRLPPDRTARPAALAVDPRSGRAIVGWTGWDGAHERARVAEADAAGRFGAARDLSAPGADAQLDDVAISRAGGRAAVWTALGAGEDSRVDGAFAPFGAPFGPPEEISPGRQASDARVAFERGTDRLVAVWVNRPAGSGGPVAGIRTYLQAASRSG